MSPPFCVGPWATCRRLGVLARLGACPALPGSHRPHRGPMGTSSDTLLSAPVAHANSYAHAKLYGCRRRLNSFRENIPSYPFPVASGPQFGSCCIKRQCLIAFLQQTGMLASWETKLIRKYAETNLNFTMCVHLWEDTRECGDLIEIKHALVLERHTLVRVFMFLQPTYYALF